MSSVNGPHEEVTFMPSRKAAAREPRMLMRVYESPQCSSLVTPLTLRAIPSLMLTICWSAMIWLPTTCTFCGILNKGCPKRMEFDISRVLYLLALPVTTISPNSCVVGSRITLSITTTPLSEGSSTFNSLVL